MPMLTLLATSDRPIKSRTAEQRWVMFTPNEEGDDEPGDLLGHGQHRGYVLSKFMKLGCVPTCIRYGFRAL